MHLILKSAILYQFLHTKRKAIILF